MHTLFKKGVFFLLLGLSLYPLSCEALSCTLDSDCTASTSFCDSDFTCHDCCEYSTDSSTCPATNGSGSGPCNWTGTECQNTDNASCNFVAETPSQTLYYFFGLIPIIGLSILLWRRRRHLS